jgi:hypothetical protein
MHYEHKDFVSCGGLFRCEAFLLFVQGQYNLFQSTIQLMICTLSSVIIIARYRYRNSWRYALLGCSRARAGCIGVVSLACAILWRRRTDMNDTFEELKKFVYEIAIINFDTKKYTP